MSKISSYLYLIEYKNGYSDKMSKEILEASIDEIFNDVSKIIKRYRLQNETKKTFYNMTLFTEDHCFSASDYIEHYNDLPKEIWGVNFLDEFDIEIINMFN
jgi:hypothetical protein